MKYLLLLWLLISLLISLASAEIQKHPEPEIEIACPKIEYLATDPLTNVTTIAYNRTYVYHLHMRPLDGHERIVYPLAKKHSFFISVDCHLFGEEEKAVFYERRVVDFDAELPEAINGKNFVSAPFEGKCMKPGHTESSLLSGDIFVPAFPCPVFDTLQIWRDSQVAGKGGANPVAVVTLSIAVVVLVLTLAGIIATIYRQKIVPAVVRM